MGNYDEEEETTEVRLSRRDTTPGIWPMTKCGGGGSPFSCWWSLSVRRCQCRQRAASRWWTTKKCVRSSVPAWTRTSSAPGRISPQPRFDGPNGQCSCKYTFKWNLIIQTVIDRIELMERTSSYVDQSVLHKQYNIKQANKQTQNSRNNYYYTYNSNDLITGNAQANLLSVGISI